GRARTTAIRGRSTSTCATSARSSKPSRGRPSTSSRCAGSATALGIERRLDGARQRAQVPAWPAAERTQLSPFRSVRARLAVALLVIVAGVLAIVYLIVVPSYQASLQNNELQSLNSALRNEVVPNFPVQPWAQQSFTLS